MPLTWPMRGAISSSVTKMGRFSWMASELTTTREKSLAIAYGVTVLVLHAAYGSSVLVNK